MYRIFAKTAAVTLAAVLFLPVKAQALSARRAAAVDAVTGQTLFSRREEEQALIASTTKIMTALVVCEQCNVLSRYRIPKEAVGIEGSSMYLKEGEVLTVQELLYGLMLSSGNDAAVALACFCGGNPGDFVELMNDKARALGLKNTHFANPNGLDAPDHYSSAHDLAVLAAYAMENPIFARTVSTKTIRVGDRMLRNHNKLLWQVAGAEGIKTGYTKAAGRALVSSASREGRRIVAVTLDAPDDWNDHRKMLEEGFTRYTLHRLFTAGDQIGTVPVVGGGGEVPLLCAGDFDFALAPEDRPQVVLAGKDFVYAPVEEGAEAGFAYVMLDGKAVGKVPLVYGATVEQMEPAKHWWNRIKESL